MTEARKDAERAALELVQRWRQESKAARDSMAVAVTYGEVIAAQQMATALRAERDADELEAALSRERSGEVMTEAQKDAALVLKLGELTARIAELEADRKRQWDTVPYETEIELSDALASVRQELDYKQGEIAVLKAQLVEASAVRAATASPKSCQWELVGPSESGIRAESTWKCVKSGWAIVRYGEPRELCEGCKAEGAAPQEVQIELRVPFSIYGRLGVGAEAWAELEGREEHARKWGFAPTSGVVLNYRTFQTVMNALRHCGEKHYVNPPSEASAARAATASPLMTDAAEMLWVVLANVSGGDWTKQSPEWQEAAARWRDYYFAAVRAASGESINVHTLAGALINFYEEQKSENIDRETIKANIAEFIRVALTQGKP